MAEPTATHRSAPDPSSEDICVRQLLARRSPGVRLLEQGDHAVEVWLERLLELGCYRRPRPATPPPTLRAFEWGHIWRTHSRISPRIEKQLDDPRVPATPREKERRTATRVG